MKQKELEVDLIGLKFGKLTVIEYSHKEKHKDKAGYKHYYSCNCDCGNMGVLVERNCLKFGKTLSCGCIHKEGLIKRNKKNSIYQNEKEF